MITLDARILPGLDEFMLRLGHLKVLCAIAVRTGGSWFRIEKQALNLLTRLVAIPSASMDEVASYLELKKLCPKSTRTADAPAADFRYPDLMLNETPGGKSVKSVTEGPPSIWWQDLCLADRRVPSKVNAITPAAKSRSKTSISHLSDWASALDLITASGEPTPEGRLLAAYCQGDPDEGLTNNPYVLGPEKLFLAHAYAQADMDALSRFAVMLKDVEQPIKKATGADAFARALQRVTDEADTNRSLSSRQQFNISQQLRELDSAARRSKRPAGATSTAWHRAASRLETYVDLGLLEKGRAGAFERYEYVYYVGPRFASLLKTLDLAQTGLDWIDTYLVDVLFDVDSSSQVQLLPHDETLVLLRDVVKALDSRTNLYPVRASALGVAARRLVEQRPVSLRIARLSIEELARSKPHLARLSRGGTGQGAEFISILRNQGAD